MWEYPVLILVGFIAGFMNTMAGGGSLLTLPLLIFMGLPAAVANGTNRVAIFMSTFSASAGFKSKGVSNFPFNVYLGISWSFNLKMFFLSYRCEHPFLFPYLPIVAPKYFSLVLI